MTPSMRPQPRGIPLFLLKICALTTAVLGTADLGAVGHSADQRDPEPYQGRRAVALYDVPLTGRVVTGSAALHEHVMAEYAFSGRWFWGSVDGPEETALRSCDGNRGKPGPTHGGAVGICDFPINLIAGPILGRDTCHHKTNGYADGGAERYREWPDWETQAHPRYWWGHLHEALHAGMKLIIVHAVENEALCHLAQAYATQPQPGSDRLYSCSHGDSFDILSKQISELKGFIANHQDFLQIAYSPAEARRIIGDRKMAVVIGVEADYAWGDPGHPIDLRERLQRYYDLGVRTAFLAHHLNTPATGAALLLKEIWAQQSFSNCFYLNVQCGTPEGHLPDPQHARQVWQGGAADRLLCRHHWPQYARNYSEVCPAVLALRAKLPGHWDGFSEYPSGGTYTELEQNYAQRAAGSSGTPVRKNALGLTPDGDVLVREMMKKGMLVDIGHISELAIRRIATISRETYNYPLVSSHTLARGVLQSKPPAIGGGYAGFEFALGDQTLEVIRQSEGIAGVFAGPDPAVDYPPSLVTNNCVQSTRSLAQGITYIADKNVAVAWAGDWMGQGRGVAPRRGFSKRPEEWCGGDPVEQQAQGGQLSPELSLNPTDPKNDEAYFGTRGLGHWGLLGALHADLESIGVRPDVLAKFKNEAAENVLRTWEKAEYIAQRRLCSECSAGSAEARKQE